MLNIINCNFEKFKQSVKGKKIIIWGCGQITENFAKLIKLENLEPDIIAFADNNSNLWNKKYTFNNKEYPIINLEKFCNILRLNNNDDIVLLISVSICISTIIEQLDKISECNNLKTYLVSYLRMFNTKYDFKFPKSKQKIPKKIHYCWFGGKEIPDNLKRYMSTWQEKCTDYEIIRWDETNYDYTKNNYMKQAYEAKKWGFVPDYARLDIIYNEGGVYLDTDVELLASLDNMLNTESFFIFHSWYQINCGSGFGSTPKNPLLKTLRDYYNDADFVSPDGNLNLKDCTLYQTPILENYGIKLNNEFQVVNDCAVYPSNIVLPTYNNFTKKFISSNTLGIHHAQVSWLDDNQRKQFHTMAEYIQER